MPARMIPKDHPLPTASRAEPPFYFRLQSQLPDEFTVIHSLKWLSSAGTRENRKVAPTGEIDFLVLHRELGILAVEVKGGRIKCEENTFKYVDTGKDFDPINQVRSGTHGLARWIGGALKLYRRFGYAVAFPDSDMHGEFLPPSLKDMSVDPPQSIAIDILDLPRIGDRIIEIMAFWNRNFGSANLLQDDIDRIITSICPDVDYTPTWTTRISRDKQEWLTLTEEQADCLRLIERVQRMVVEGRSGTGKTLLAIELARRLSSQGERVLFVTYNRALLEKKLKPELRDTPTEVTSFHELCRIASGRLRRAIPPTGTRENDEWFRVGGPNSLHDAIMANRMEDFDALIVDEGQVLHTSWFEDLSTWFSSKRIVVFCDESQVFNYESDQSSTAREIAAVVAALEPFTLTINLRSPQAVFNRLRETAPANYQEMTLRPVEPDTLSEFMESRPDKRLYSVLTELSDVGVPLQSVVILCVGSEQPPASSIPTNYAPNIESIYRYRGLESSVVIVYAVRAVSDGAIICAYTRATSRCIVIYDTMVFLLRHQSDPSFTSRLTSSMNPPANLRLLLDTADPMRITTPLQRIEIDSIKLSWAPQWKGWVIDKDDSIDWVHTTLWRDCILQYSKYRVYETTTQNLLSAWVQEWLPVSNISEVLTSDPQQALRWCSDCGRWTRAKLDRSSQHWDCEEEKPEPSPVVPREEIEHFIAAGKTLTNWSNLSVTDKKQLPVALFALAYWRSIPSETQSLVTDVLDTQTGEIDRFIAALFVSIDVVKAVPGTEIYLAELRKRYLGWNPKLRSEVDEARWRVLVSNKTGGLLTRGVIKAESEGVYRRQEYWPHEIPF